MEKKPGVKRHNFCDLDIQDIRCFVVYIEEGTSTAAGKRLNMTPANVIYRAKVIQKHIGIPMYLESATHALPHSGGRHFTDLTELGKIVFTILKDILQRYDNLVELMRAYNPTPGNTRMETTHGVPFNMNPAIPQTAEVEAGAVTVYDQIRTNFPGVFGEGNVNFYPVKEQLAKRLTRTD